ncbi:hypothetical protein Pmani_010427 [Petrolisthes manimaculis]|uniref:Uncharacterized protein n=1 Tax=Petrolisthes manimaculis TaxID=1843537 RepID=A0AAE1Q4H9_9EUCA|nr:hypothetical protein Pmani_019499 [Petrolisthes manimaculis]KAK4318577.1 hypothetical protein Pmani_010427 [Petrolisthes manimaculis]
MDTRIKILEDNVESIKSNISSETTSENAPNEICRIMEDRISALEETTTGTQNSTSNPSNNVSKTLLLGDINLSTIRASDLNTNCKIRTWKDANVDLLKCWVHEKLSWNPAKCIVYYGLCDVMDNESPASIIDNLGSLVSELKNKNENMEVCIS